MDNFNETSPKTDHFSNPAKRPKSGGRWTLLFIGNHGRTITLKRFKGMVLLTLVVLCLSIAITVGLLFLSLNIRKEKAQLESQMNDLKSQIKTLRYEKDVLMTRLVLAESHLKANPDKIQEKQEAPDPAAQVAKDSEKPEQPAEEASALKTGPVPEQNEPDEEAAPSDTQLSVALEDFKISPQPDKNLLRFQFKIKNTSANSQRVAGSTVVVLKGDQTSPAKWMAVPPMPLVDGRPTGRQKGYAFGINYFKTMRFSSNYPKYPDRYQVATVYVFTQRGDLLLAKEFPVKLPSASHDAPAGSPEPKGTLPSAPPAASSDASPPADETMNTEQNTAAP